MIIKIIFVHFNSLHECSLVIDHKTGLHSIQNENKPHEGLLSSQKTIDTYFKVNASN